MKTIVVKVTPSFEKKAKKLLNEAVLKELFDYLEKILKMKMVILFQELPVLESYVGKQEIITGEKVVGLEFYIIIQKIF